MKWPWTNPDDWVPKALHIRELGAREAAIAYEQQNHASTKETLGRMTIACRELETRLRDCEDPPITRKELEDLSKRHSFVVRKAETLEQMNLELSAELKEVQEKLKAKKAKANGVRSHK